MYIIFIKFHGIEHKVELPAASRNHAAAMVRKQHPGYSIVSIQKA